MYSDALSRHARPVELGSRESSEEDLLPREEASLDPEVDRHYNRRVCQPMIREGSLRLRARSWMQPEPRAWYTSRSAGLGFARAPSAWRGSSTVEQGTHKPLVRSSNLRLATPPFSAKDGTQSGPGIRAWRRPSALGTDAHGPERPVRRAGWETALLRPESTGGLLSGDRSPLQVSSGQVRLVRPRWTQLNPTA